MTGLPGAAAVAVLVTGTDAAGLAWGTAFAGAGAAATGACAVVFGCVLFCRETTAAGTAAAAAAVAAAGTAALAAEELGALSLLASVTGGVCVTLLEAAPLVADLAGGAGAAAAATGLARAALGSVLGTDGACFALSALAAPLVGAVAVARFALLSTLAEVAELVFAGLLDFVIPELLELRVVAGTFSCLADALAGLEGEVRLLSFLSKRLSSLLGPWLLLDFLVGEALRLGGLLVVFTDDLLGLSDFSSDLGLPLMRASFAFAKAPFAFRKLIGVRWK